MISEFDQKGKIYTDVVPKKNVTATIQTLTHRIHGEIHIRPDERLVDELNRSETFLAITHADVYDTRGQKIYSTEFMTLNNKLIIWLIPDEEINDNPESGGQE